MKLPLKIFHSVDAIQICNDPLNVENCIEPVLNEPKGSSEIKQVLMLYHQNQMLCE